MIAVLVVTMNMVNTKLMMKSMKAIVVIIVMMKMVDTKMMTKSMR